MIVTVRWYGVVAAPSARTTASDPTHGEPGPSQCAVVREGINGIGRARRFEPARRRSAGQHPAVAPNRQKEESRRRIRLYRERCRCHAPSRSLEEYSKRRASHRRVSSAPIVEVDASNAGQVRSSPAPATRTRRSPDGKCSAVWAKIARSRRRTLFRTTAVPTVVGMAYAILNVEPWGAQFTRSGPLRARTGALWRARNRRGVLTRCTVGRAERPPSSGRYNGTPTPDTVRLLRRRTSSGRQLRPALGPSSFQNGAAACRSHAGAEAVLLGPPAVVGLKSALHDRNLPFAARSAASEPSKDRG